MGLKRFQRPSSPKDYLASMEQYVLGILKLSGKLSSDKWLIFSCMKKSVWNLVKILGTPQFSALAALYVGTRCAVCDMCVGKAARANSFEKNRIKVKHIVCRVQWIYMLNAFMCAASEPPTSKLAHSERGPSIRRVSPKLSSASIAETWQRDAAMGKRCPALGSRARRVSTVPLNGISLEDQQQSNIFPFQVHGEKTLACIMVDVFTKRLFHQKCW